MRLVHKPRISCIAFDQATCISGIDLMVDGGWIAY
jgi:hypothetical protein